MKSLIDRCQNLLVAGVIAMSAAGGVAYANTETEEARIQSIAEDAYVYGLPLVSSYAVMYTFSLDPSSVQYKAPLNHTRCMSTLATPEDKAIAFVNNDTLYCAEWMDLRAEPRVISVPASEKSRYFSAMLMDISSVNFGLIGDRTTGAATGDFLVAGPDWQGETPKGIKNVFRSTTQFALVVFRTQLKNVMDVDNVKAIQAGYRVRSLASFLGTSPAPVAPEIAFPKIDRDLAKANFFAYLDFVLRFTPVRSEDKDVRARLASIGLGTGNFDDFKVVAGKYRAQLMQGVQAGEKRINALVADAGPRENGWNWNSSLDTDRAHYTGDYAKRAALARSAPVGLNSDEAMYPMTNALANGEPLDGSKHSYKLIFKKGELPPVTKFWSLTMYHGASRSLVENPLHRYNISSAMLPKLKSNADGSLSIYLQKDSPGKDKEANWLPAPDGPMYLMLRVYGIGERLRAKTWAIPAVEVTN